MKKPNLFIIGAPKCGTTALASYLSAHPQVYFPPNKEPTFFNTDMTVRTFRSLSDYERLFAAAGPDHVAIGEGSTLYLYSSEAVRNILNYNPEARFVVILRNPVEMVQSWHSQIVFTLDEHIRCFETAWRAQSRRRQGREIGSRCRDVRLLLYGDIGMLGTQLQRVYEVAPEDRVIALLLDDLKASPAAVYERVVRFLDLPPDGRRDFMQLNQNKEFRSGTIQHVLETAASVKRRLGIKKRTGMLRPIRRFNTVQRPRPPLSEAMQQELADHFRDDVRVLARLLQRDLSHWL